MPNIICAHALKCWTLISMATHGQCCDLTEQMDHALQVCKELISMLNSCRLVTHASWFLVCAHKSLPSWPWPSHREALWVCDSRWLTLFLPNFAGATFGRLLGELTKYFYPQSLVAMEVVPGGYAVVGEFAVNQSSQWELTTFLWHWKSNFH